MTVHGRAGRWDRVARLIPGRGLDVSHRRSRSTIAVVPHRGMTGCLVLVSLAALCSPDVTITIYAHACRNGFDLKWKFGGCFPLSRWPLI